MILDQKHVVFRSYADLEALGDATRLAILSRLASEGDMTVQEIAQPRHEPAGGVAAPEGIGAGLIARGRDGQKRPCRLNAERLAETARWFDHTRAAWEARLDRLERFLAGVVSATSNPPNRKVKTMATLTPHDLGPEREIVLSAYRCTALTRVPGLHRSEPDHALVRAGGLHDRDPQSARASRFERWLSPWPSPWLGTPETVRRFGSRRPP